ncbi:alpha/beta hydrolase [Aquabacterium sp. OR-4]|uniref:alpha/beta hydrolase n=1 Tax=Aquabacterium sp. OR-4 TaxID=2978127 RepID=UPI0021B45DDF|nr:alpha/beta hydrolase [Aquabacterium sp. OR-4]MDT7836260.1 alpha/beta hydrolase [Aquabacterium sp. OR-4]
MPQHDAAWYEAQYNNRARVPEAPALLAAWAAASAQARRGLRGQLDLRYGDGPADTVDVFVPPAPAGPGAPGAPVLVFIHGGYWRALGKADHSFVAPAFVRAGAVVVVPDYALCPAVGIEHIALQMARALAWVWRHAADWGGDPSRIVVAGHSAGGHLAAMLLACRWPDLAGDLPRRLLRGALALSGLFDLEPIRCTPFLQADLQLTPAAVRRLSPAFFPRPQHNGPLAALVGADESEEFLRQNQLIRDQWGPSAVPVCQVVPGCNHFSVLGDLADAAGLAHGHALFLLGLRGGR